VSAPETFCFLPFGNQVLALTVQEFQTALERGLALVGGATDKRPASANGEEERLVTAAEVARLINMPEAWVYESARRGTIPCLRLGAKAVRFRASEVFASFPSGAGGKAS
jgi:predicted DNA-binding transcriptional regulator AlpA